MGYWKFAAELNPHLDIIGIEWTHLLKRVPLTSLVSVFLGRRLTNEYQLFPVGAPFPGVPYPYGYTVFPDSP